MAKDQLVNEQINAREVMVIGEGGERLGVMPTPQALRVARERGLDLVAVASTAVPPVCRILNYGKFRYEQTKKEREAKRGQKTGLLREVRFRPRIDDHDIEFKIRLISKLLQEGDRVKVSVMFRGREMARPERGLKLLEKVTGTLEKEAAQERPPILEGRFMSLILASKKGKETKTSETKTSKEPSSGEVQAEKP